MSFTVGSLFDGSGGFPLAAFMCGGVPVWASEIEPYPIAVTKSRFPYVKHLGSVTNVKGNEIEPVDVITFGSPCQDLSVAGLRKGLKHEDNGDDETTRSGLFMEAVRIIKEMREATNGKYPTFALWENVPGAFSSNKGEDFRVVLEELIKIVEPTASMPSVPKNGWPYADCYSGDGWSLAYRVFDAQFWGVPQRRRRIYALLDLRGERAHEVLFEREGLRGYFTEGRTPWQATTADAERCLISDDRERNSVAYSFDALSSNSMKSSNPHSGCRKVDVAKCLDTADPNPSKNQGGIAVVEAFGFDGYNSCDTGDKSSTLGVNCGMSTGRNGVVVPYTLKIRSGCEGGGKGALIQTDMSATLSTLNDQYLFQPISAGFKEHNSPEARSIGYELERSPTLSANKHDAAVCVKCYDARGNGDGDTVSTITGDHENRITDYTSVVVSEETIALEGNGQRPSHHGDGYVVSDKSYTLNTTEVHGVVYAVDQGGGKSQANVTENLSPTLTCTHGGEPAIVLDRAFYNQGQNALYDPQYYEDGLVPPLVARGPSAVCYENPPKYIVRRLTPTECARLQGFPDEWGHPDKKDDFTDEEYRFWLNVRNTHAEINGKTVKEYTKEQMLTWYNKLHTDSSEYKLWGNGIALPNALYVMQGISDVLN